MRPCIPPMSPSVLIERVRNSWSYVTRGCPGRIRHREHTAGASCGLGFYDVRLPLDSRNEH